MWVMRRWVSMVGWLGSKEGGRYKMGDMKRSVELWDFEAEGRGCRER